jgi:hypothetical protein
VLAGLIYLIGLLTVLVNLVVAGTLVPAAASQVSAALDSGTANVFNETLRAAMGFAPYVWPVLTGLLLMGFGRVIMLLGAINRSLRGQA